MDKRYGFIALLLGAFITFFGWIFKSLFLGIGLGVGMGLPLSAGLWQRIRKSSKSK